MDTYKITPLKLGTITRKKSNMVAGADDTLTEFPLLAFLLEGADRKVLVDTGGTAPDGRWLPYERESGEDLASALASAGVKPEEIEAVIFTHLHWDHAGANDVLKNATLYAQKAEYEMVTDGSQPGYDRELVKQSSYELIDGDKADLFPGISVVLAPGHSVGGQCVIVKTNDGPVVLAGDLLPTRENIDKKIPNGGNYDLDEITRSIEKVLALSLPVIPGHEL